MDIQEVIDIKYEEIEGLKQNLSEDHYMNPEQEDELENLITQAIKFGELCAQRDAKAQAVPAEFEIGRLKDQIADLLDERQDLYAQLDAEAVPEWISVEDEPPTSNKTFSDAVIAWDGLCIRRIPLCLFKSTSEVTHWMPIPQPPKAQEPVND